MTAGELRVLRYLLVWLGIVIVLFGIGVYLAVDSRLDGDDLRWPTGVAFLMGGVLHLAVIAGILVGVTSRVSKRARELTPASGT